MQQPEPITHEYRKGLLQENTQISALEHSTWILKHVLYTLFGQTEFDYHIKDKR